MKVNFMLLGILFLSLVYGFSLNHKPELPADVANERDLLSVSNQDIDTISVEMTNGRVTLVKNSQDWLIAELDDYPADRQRVERLLNQLNSLSSGNVVSNSDAAAARFGVAYGSSERKIELFAGDERLVELYVGSPRGADNSYVRLSGSKDVKVVNLPHSILGENASDWISYELLSHDANAVESIVIDEKKISSSLSWWGGGESISNLTGDALGIEQLLGKLARITAEQVEPAGSMNRDFDRSLTVNLRNGDQYYYQFYELPDETFYLIKRSDKSLVFKVPAYQVEPIFESIG